MDIFLTNVLSQHFLMVNYPRSSLEERGKGREVEKRDERKWRSVDQKKHTHKKSQTDLLGTFFY